MTTRGVPAAAVVVLASALAGGAMGTRAGATQDGNRINERFAMYQVALNAIDREYVEPVDGAQVVYSSIDGLLRTLDPHSTFLDPRAYERQREQQGGRYPGIGITIVPVDGQITVTGVFEGSPAYRAGIRRNDVIARVGQPADEGGKKITKWEETKGWPTEEVVKRVRGPKGTTVEISIRRPGVDQLIDLTVERDTISITSVRTAFMIAPGTGYIRLQEFAKHTDEELGEALASLKKQGMVRLMFDLRDNPGGELDQAIAVASRFLKSGQMVVYTRGRVQGSAEDYRVETTGGVLDTPMVVMVNRNSASASEIVSGAMQDHDRAILVGETTFGKALVQGVYKISEGAGLALTTGHFFTPSERLIQRPWDAAFDEYLTYSYTDQKPRVQEASQLKYTDSGRKVYSGGGIDPDHFVPGPVEGFNPSRFSRMLRERGAFIVFAERFTKEGDARPAAKSAAAAHKVAPGWEVTDAMVKEFRDYIVGERVRFDETGFNADTAFIKAMIHFEVDADLFGMEEARRNLSRVDPQIQAALGYFDEAKALLSAKKTSGK